MNEDGTVLSLQTLCVNHCEMTANVFFGKDGEFLILPMSMNAEGGCTGVNQPERLMWDGVSDVRLGEKVLRCLAVSAVTPGLPLSSPPAAVLATGAKSFHVFSKTRYLVYVNIPESGDCLTVQLWPRNANAMFVGPPCERTDLRLTLPVDATPEAIGAAVIQVLRAGGVDISGRPRVEDDVSDDDDHVGYVEFREALVSDYGLASVSRGTPTEAISSLLESVNYAIGEDARLFHCAVMTCSLICLGQGFLPDYLVEPARGLADISGQFTGADLVAYQEDAALLRERLAAPHEVVEAPYIPDYFPGTWFPSEASQAWWDGLLKGVSPEPE